MTDSALATQSSPEFVTEAQERAVTRFLYREARLLDERRYDEWLDMIDDSLDYVVFSRSVPEPRPRTPGLLEAEFQAIGGLQLTEDSKPSLQYRINRLNSGLTFSETPPGRTVRLVTNIEVMSGRLPGELLVESCLHCNRSRKEHNVENYYARRKDVVIVIDGQMRLLKRHVLLNQSTLGASSLSIFF